MYMPHRICACSPLLLPFPSTAACWDAGCSLSNTDAPSIYLFLPLSLSPQPEHPSSATKDMVNAIDRKPLSLSLSFFGPSSLLISSYLPLPISSTKPPAQMHALDRYSCVHARLASPSRLWPDCGFSLTELSSPQYSSSIIVVDILKNNNDMSFRAVTVGL